MQLSPDQIDDIAEKAADKAVEKVIQRLENHFYQNVGRSVVSKLLWAIGVVSVGLYFYLQSHGVIK